MSLVGVVCKRDGQCRSFEECIRRHEYEPHNSCHAPLPLLKAMRDNHKTRKNAYYSATMLLSCPRAIALQEKYDYYEALDSGWNKYRGTLMHWMMEDDPDPREGIIKEQRFYKIMEINGVKIIVTGQPDKIDTIFDTITDYKSAYRLPTKPKPDHIAQFNIYIWLVDGGYYMDKDNPPDPKRDQKIKLKIKGGGMHYMTFEPKEAWKKIGYPVWTKGDTEAFILERLAPLAAWKRTNDLPECNPFQRFPGKWRCDCVKLTEQLTARGIIVNEQEI